MLLDKNKYIVLKEFLYNDKGIYGSFVARKNFLNQKTVCNVLKFLEGEGFLKFKSEGKNKIYFLNKDRVGIRDVVKMIEVQSKIGFLERNKKFEKLFLELESMAKGVLIIFGSYAKGLNKSSSDLDVLVIGSIGDVSDLEESFGLEINVVNVKKSKFSLDENFIREVLDNHVVLKGVDEFVDLYGKY